MTRKATALSFYKKRKLSLRVFMLCSAAVIAGAPLAYAQNFQNLPDFNVLTAPTPKEKKGFSPQLIAPDQAPAETPVVKEDEPPPPLRNNAPTEAKVKIPEVTVGESNTEAPTGPDMETPLEFTNEDSPYGNISNTPAAQNLPPAPDARPKKGSLQSGADQSPRQGYDRNKEDVADRYKMRPTQSPAYSKQYQVENLHLPTVQYEAEYIRLFFDAVAADNIDAVRGLYHYFKTTEFRDASMNTPLMYASMLGRRRMVEILLGMGANPNSYNRYRVTPLMISAKEKRHDFASLLLHYGATPDLTDKHGHTALMYAASSNSPETVMLLARYGADLNAARFSDASSALHLAVHYNNPEAAYMLLKNGANPDVMNTHRITPLMLAANYNNGVLARLLLKFSADPFLIDRKGRTAENFAWSRKNFNLAKTLSRYRFNRERIMRSRPPRYPQPMPTQPYETPYPPPPYYSAPGQNAPYAQQQPQAIPPAQSAPSYNTSPYASPSQQYDYEDYSYEGRQTIRPLRNDYSDYESAPVQEPDYPPAYVEEKKQKKDEKPKKKKKDKRIAPRLNITPITKLKPSVSAAPEAEPTREVEPPKKRESKPKPTSAPPKNKSGTVYTPPPYSPPPMPVKPKAPTPTPVTVPEPEPTPIAPKAPPLDKSVVTPPAPPQEEENDDFLFELPNQGAPRSPSRADTPPDLPDDILREFDNIRAAPPPPAAPSGDDAEFSIIGEPQETEFSKQELEEMQRILRDLEKDDDSFGAPPQQRDVAPSRPQERKPVVVPSRPKAPKPQAPPPNEDEDRVELLENFYNSMKDEMQSE